MNGFAKFAERHPAALTLLAMWIFLSLLCFFIYFFSSDVNNDSVKEFPKIVFEAWKFLTGATMSALAALAKGVKDKKQEEQLPN